MARIFIMVLCFCAVLNGYSQNTDLEVVAPAGTSYKTPDMGLDWTLGEPITLTLENSSFILSQGFHQPKYTLVSVKPLPADIGSVQVFPNPFLSEVAVKASFNTPETGLFELYDMQGQKIWDKPFEGSELLESFPAASLSSGAYLLLLRIPGKSITHTFKLLKTE